MNKCVKFDWSSLNGVNLNILGEVVWVITFTGFSENVPSDFYFQVKGTDLNLCKIRCIYGVNLNTLGPIVRVLANVKVPPLPRQWQQLVLFLRNSRANKWKQQESEWGWGGGEEWGKEPKKRGTAPTSWPWWCRSLKPHSPLTSSITTTKQYFVRYYKWQQLTVSECRLPRDENALGQQSKFLINVF